ncbi:MAG: FecCD family ABC transporter permease [Candidatus Bipolaricaulaceae bacterium]
MKKILLFLLLLDLASALLALGFGPTRLSLPQILASLLGSPGREGLIVRELRAPRVLAGLVVGGGLGLADAVMQGVFRNPLADPYLLGVANGAAVGVAVALALGLAFPWATPLSAFFGGGIAVFLVWEMGHKRRELGLILAGIALAAIFSALTSFLLLTLGPGKWAEEFLFWSLGSLARVTWRELWILGPWTLLTAVALLPWARDLNALALGEEGAWHLGVNPIQARRFLLGLSALLVSTSVASTGVVAFVGLVTPHAVRLILGPDHRRLLPSSALAEGILLVWADVAARTIRAPAELPLGIVTALVGAPFFLYLLRRELRP